MANQGKFMPFVSVIVPVYKVEKYLRECLDSLVNQSLKDIEIICVDDGSPDNCGQILDEYAGKDPRIKVIHQKNGGLSNARNSGLKEASGKYISFVDSDDFVNSEFLEKLYEAAERNQADITVGSIIRKREHHEKFRVHYTGEKRVETLPEKIALCNVPKCCYVVSKLYRRELIIDEKFTENVYFEDVLWLPGILKKSGILATAAGAVYYYRANPSSTVKQRQSAKKIFDRANSKRFIIRFFEGNGLPLTRRDRTLNKKTVYFGKIPLLKVKEFENRETFYLFGLLPVFRRKIADGVQFRNKRRFFLIRKVDAHINIELLGKIRIAAKNGAQFEYHPAKNSGLAAEKRSPQLIVSLTSFPGRIGSVDRTVNTLLQQTLKPDRLVLYLAGSQFPGGTADLPESLLELQGYGLEIRWCDDLRSYKKLVPALRDFPEDIIVTADDDIYYQSDWLESLYRSFLRDPDCIHTRRACFLKYYNNGLVDIYAHYANGRCIPYYGNQLMGGAGTLYPPHSLHEDVFDTGQIKTLIPTYDDIYFWAMAVINGKKIVTVRNHDVNIWQREETGNSGLCKINNGSAGMSPHEAFRRIFERYPEILSRLEQESR